MIDNCTEIPLADAEAEFDALIERVEAGETIIITRDGKPVARLCPSPVFPDRGFGVSDKPAAED